MKQCRFREENAKLCAEQPTACTRPTSSGAERNTRDPTLSCISCDLQDAALAAEGDALDAEGPFAPDPELGRRLRGVVADGRAWEAAAEAMLRMRKARPRAPLPPQSATMSG